MCCSYFVLEVGNRSLSQLVTVYPALPRQPAGDLFPRGGGLEIVFLSFFNQMLKLLVHLCFFERGQILVANLLTF